jgi:hypothetical protein
MTGKKRTKWEWLPHNASDVFDLHFDFVGDFSRPPTRVELEGDRAKKKFVAKYYQLQTLMGTVLCNQPEERVAKAKTEVREFPREIKRYD